MFTGSLREQDNAGYDQDRQNSRGIEPTKSQSTIRDRLVEKVTRGGAQGSRQDERAPEQQRTRNIGVEIGCRDDDQAGCENQRATLVAEAVGVGHPGAKRGTQRLREKNRRPVKHLTSW